MSRSDKFEDQYEGTFSEPTMKIRESVYPDFLKFYKTHREQVAISSWHINEYESFACGKYSQNTEDWPSIYNRPIAKCTSSRK
jgi:hypothetical protein